MEGSDGPPPEGSPEIRQRAYTASIAQAGTLAAPPLAGFSLAVIVLVLQQPRNFAYPDATLALLTCASLFFILAVQCAIATERVGLTQPDAFNLEDEERDQGNALREATRLAYNIALALFFAGITVALVPDDNPSTGRWIAIAVAGVGCLREAPWVLQALTSLHKDKFQLPMIWLGAVRFKEPTREPPPGPQEPHAVSERAGQRG
jgi:hypothetical protein